MSKVKWANRTRPIYTLVRHSAYYVGKPGFVNAVELRSIETKTQYDKVVADGGLLFASYTEASDAEYEENYPAEVDGIYPEVRGTFSTRTVQGQHIYVPAKKKQVSKRKKKSRRKKAKVR
jgi:hypothetical protein